MIVTNSGKKYKFVVDHHFIEGAMKVPDGERGTHPIWQILYFALAVKDENPSINVLWTTKAVDEYIKKAYPLGKDEKHKMLHNFVLGHLISIDGRQTSDIPVSLKLCASEEFGCMSYLICDESIEKQISEGGTSFTVCKPDKVAAILHKDIKHDLPFNLKI